jgi:hypothetical protein
MQTVRPSSRQWRDVGVTHEVKKKLRMNKRYEIANQMVPLPTPTENFMAH